MSDGLKWNFWTSRTLLLNRSFLWLLFFVNLCGTIYGYIWYWNQLVYTVETKPLWMLPFVPDSPTASLFFTLTIGFFIWDQSFEKDRALTKGKSTPVRSFVEAFALITSFKYGIWAVVMIFATTAKGVPMLWQDWMLVGSHLGMAAEALLYARFYRMTIVTVSVVAAWTLANDYLDYHEHIFPNLHTVLHPHLSIIETFTVILSLLGIFIAFIFVFRRKQKME